MKNIFLFLLPLFFITSLSASLVHAATWEWIDSDAETGYFFDSESIKYELNHDYLNRASSVDTNRITYWKKVVYTPEGAEKLVNLLKDENFYDVRSSKSLETISLSDKTITCYTVVFYDARNEVIYSEDGAAFVHTIVPESWDELVLNTIRSYASAHKDLLMKNAYAND